MKTVLFILTSILIGSLIYSLASIFSAIVIGGPKSDPPGIYTLLICNIIAIGFISWLGNLFKLSSIYPIVLAIWLYVGFTIWGMVSLSQYSWFHYIIVMAAGSIGTYLAPEGFPNTIKN